MKALSAGNVHLELLNSLSILAVEPGQDQRGRGDPLQQRVTTATYYARVSGSGSMEGVQYSLLVTRGGEFDLEPNSGELWATDPAQSIELVPTSDTPLGDAVVLGHARNLGHASNFTECSRTGTSTSTRDRE